MATALAAHLAAMPYLPGDKALWRDPETGQWHPVTVLLTCCEASVGGGFYDVCDEFGWTHLATAGELRPRAEGPDYAPRAPAPRPAS